MLVWLVAFSHEFRRFRAKMCKIFANVCRILRSAWNEAASLAGVRDWLPIHMNLDVLAATSAARWYQDYIMYEEVKTRLIKRVAGYLFPRILLLKVFGGCVILSDEIIANADYLFSFIYKFIKLLTITFIYFIHSYCRCLVDPDSDIDRRSFFIL